MPLIFLKTNKCLTVFGFSVSDITLFLLFSLFIPSLFFPLSFKHYHIAVLQWIPDVKGVRWQLRDRQILLKPTKKQLQICQFCFPQCSARFSLLVILQDVTSLPEDYLQTLLIWLVGGPKCILATIQLIWNWHIWPSKLNFTILMCQYAILVVLMGHFNFSEPTHAVFNIKLNNVKLKNKTVVTLSIER